MSEILQGTALSELPVMLPNGSDTFVSVRDNGDGTFTDFRATVEKVNIPGRKLITVPTTAGTLTDSFFSSPISELIVEGTPNETYIFIVNFTQSGTTITGIGGLTFTAGDRILARV